MAPSDRLKIVIKDLRNNECKKLRNRIVEIQTIKLSKEMRNERIRSLPENSFNLKQLEKNISDIQDKDGELVCINERLEAVARGDMDKNLIDLAQTVLEKIELKSSEKLKKKRDEAEKKRKDKLAREEFWRKKSKPNSGSNNNTYSARMLDKLYMNYISNCDSIPDYICHNLTNMPNNKGYIWKGIFCYGKLPAEVDQPTVVYEKNRNSDTITVHEWDTSKAYRNYQIKSGKPI